MPSFPEFYRALNASHPEPFPWQRRLADEVATTERWRSEVGVPTGLGKTACLDIAVWWLASQADRKPAERTAPTRIWWVVNRRLLVDSTDEHAKKIAEALSDPGSANVDKRDREVLARVALRLSSMSAEPGSSPLEVIRLRGGVASRTPADPSQPTVLLCTLPMYGSRLLFRGYGSNQRLRVVDAAMAGTDSLVLLDEAHLAPHLKALLPALADCTPGTHATISEARSRPRIAALTATGDVGSGQRFDLDDEDKADPVVRQRLDAVKPLELRVETGDSARRLADTTFDLLREASAPAACVVFANTPRTARETFDRLRKLMPEASAEILLLTGLTREREAERVRARILDRDDGMAAARAATVGRQRHLIAVATQTLEVGADIDAEYLVTEACGVRALTQRLGRLNRLGRYLHARAAYVHLPPPKPKRGRTATDPDTWPVYGTEPTSVLERLQAARAADGTVGLSPRQVAEVLGPPQDLAWPRTGGPPRNSVGVDEDDLAARWRSALSSRTSAALPGPQYSLSLIWRVHVPEDGERLWPRATDREAIDVPIGEARDVLADDELCRLASDGVTVETTSSADLRPGDQIVLPADRGLLDAFGWNPAAADPVVDVSLLAHGLPLDTKAIERLCGVAAGEGSSRRRWGSPTTTRTSTGQRGLKRRRKSLAQSRAASTPSGLGSTRSGSLSPRGLAHRSWRPAGKCPACGSGSQSRNRSAATSTKHRSELTPSNWIGMGRRWRHGHGLSPGALDCRSLWRTWWSVPDGYTTSGRPTGASSDGSTPKQERGRARCEVERAAPPVGGDAQSRPAGPGAAATKTCRLDWCARGCNRIPTGVNPYSGICCSTW